MIVLFLVSLLSPSLLADDDCRVTMAEDSWVTDTFVASVVHGVHSITLQDLRRFFHPAAPLANNIPCVNPNLSSAAAPVLASVPSLPLSNPFSSAHMDALDLTLSHMTDNDFDIRNAPPLERLVHALHMVETWELAAPFYTRFVFMKSKKGRARLSKLCPCVTDVHENGIWRSLESLAVKMRDEEGTGVWRYGPGASYGCRWCGGGNVLLPVRQEREAEGIPTDRPTTNLTTEAEWEVWKVNLDMRKGMNKMLREMALFIFCSLNLPYFPY